MIRKSPADLAFEQGPAHSSPERQAYSYDGNGTLEGALAYDHLGPDARQRLLPLMGMADQSYYAGDGLNKALS